MTSRGCQSPLRQTPTDTAGALARPADATQGISTERPSLTSFLATLEAALSSCDRGRPLQMTQEDASSECPPRRRDIGWSYDARRRRHCRQRRLNAAASIRPSMHLRIGDCLRQRLRSFSPIGFLDAGYCPRCRITTPASLCFTIQVQEGVSSLSVAGLNGDGTQLSAWALMDKQSRGTRRSLCRQLAPHRRVRLASSRQLPHNGATLEGCVRQRRTVASLSGSTLDTACRELEDQILTAIGREHELTLGGSQP